MTVRGLSDFWKCKVHQTRRIVPVMACLGVAAPAPAKPFRSFYRPIRFPVSSSRQAGRRKKLSVASHHASVTYRLGLCKTVGLLIFLMKAATPISRPKEALGSNGLASGLICKSLEPPAPRRSGEAICSVDFTPPPTETDNAFEIPTLSGHDP
jgi:hypothetical protein